MRKITFSKEIVEDMAVIGGILLTLAALWSGSMHNRDLDGLVYIVAAMATVGGLLLGVSGALFFISKRRSRRQQRW